MRGAAVVLLLVATTAWAEPRTRAALLPTVASGRDPAEAKMVAAVESALIEAARKLPGLELVNLEGTHLRPLGRSELREQRPRVRAESLLSELGAELVIVSDPQPLGDGAVVYLQMIEGGGRTRGSTTVALSAAELAAAAERERLLRGGLVQIIAPARYVGRLELHVDVKGALTEIDGKKIVLVPGAALELAVGPHAVRVTHPAYRDFQRFVDVAYDRSSIETVALAAFPLTEGEMADRRRATPGAKVKVPWYRSWWALGVGGAVVVGVTTGIVFGVRAGVSAQHDATYRAQPGP